MRRATRGIGIGVVLLVSVVLAGCLGVGSNGEAVSGVDTNLTLEGAKKTAMAMELELAAMVPADIVTSIDQHPTGVLLSCQGDRAYQWTGETNVTVSSPPDAEALVDTIVARYRETDGYTARRETTVVDDQPFAHVIGAYGAGYIVGPSADKTAVEISSFSPCFVLPEDMSPGDTY